MLKLRLIMLVGVIGIPLTLMGQEEAADPPEVALGERLFLETRFSQFFKAFLDTGGGINNPLPTGDPVVDQTATTHAPLPGPFSGTSINCRSCHLVDEHVETPGGGMRTYADFARRSPVPDRTDDPAHTATRNAPALVNASLPRDAGLLLHFDGEFASVEDLVRGTFAGRNFGWRPGEKRQAIATIARVIREDDGQGALAADFGGLPYSVVLAGISPQIPEGPSCGCRGNSGSTSTVPPIARSSTPWPDWSPPTPSSSSSRATSAALSTCRRSTCSSPATTSPADRNRANPTSSTAAAW